MTTSIPSLNPSAAAPEPRGFGGRIRRGDKIFKAGSMTTGLIVLAIMGGVGLFLTIRAYEALNARGFAFFTTQSWDVNSGDFGVAAVLGFTVLIALVAVAIAVPISTAVALFITEVAPPRARGALVALVDLMAAVPSVVYGLWGRELLQGHLIPLSRFINTTLGWMPWFDVSGVDPNDPLLNLSRFSASSFIAGVVVAMMVIPLQASVMREVFSQVPSGEREGAYALGATRWGQIRAVTLPFGRGGIIGGTMLGLGRALGETIAVVMIISPRFDFTWHILEVGSNSISSLIALRFIEAPDFELSALFAAGLTLFVITLAVNFGASILVARSRSGASSEA